MGEAEAEDQSTMTISKPDSIVYGGSMYGKLTAAGFSEFRFGVLRCKGETRLIGNHARAPHFHGNIIFFTQR